MALRNCTIYGSLLLDNAIHEGLLRNSELLV